MNCDWCLGLLPLLNREIPKSCMHLFPLGVANLFGIGGSVAEPPAREWFKREASSGKNTRQMK